MNEDFFSFSLNLNAYALYLCHVTCIQNWMLSWLFWIINEWEVSGREIEKACFKNPEELNFNNRDSMRYDVTR